MFDNVLLFLKTSSDINSNNSLNRMTHFAVQQAIIKQVPQEDDGIDGKIKK
jgi:hypothetical protein